MASLTPEEQRFFETGELQPGMTPGSEAPSPAPAPEGDAAPLDAIALAGVGSVTPEPLDTAAPAPAPAAPAPAPAIEPPSDATEILRRSLAEAHQRVGQLEQYIQQQQPPAPAAPPAPDKSLDPLGAMMHELEQVNKTVVALQGQLQQQQQQQTMQQNFAAFQTQVRSLRDQFTTTTPDFPDAYAHIRDNRVSDLRAYGYTDDQIKQVVFQEEAALAQSAIQQGRNPAEVIYEMSKRHGYVPKAAAPVPAPAANAPAAPDKKLQAIQQAQSAARSLPKSPEQSDLSVEGLRAASDADLNRLVLDPKAWSKIAGGDTYPL